MVNFVRRLKAKMKRTMMLILKRLPFPFPEHRINDLPEPRPQKLAITFGLWQLPAIKKLNDTYPS
ncbi:unnamed protein product [Prunus armeniaca]|uniref:Uncharacterized protein n=1 Tax=Prunus armeniaca TaxID=36596 RepID=A0A6J5TEH3_PRUAR|nr:unnamed protein product [Prunus armeniaca]